jgi:phosphohistidine phosphatase SixA/8-oxo-dGTP pyrophosphatase MutT (NUDIX family)
MATRREALAKGLMTESDTIRAAGGVLWREATTDVADPAVEVAIIHRPRYGDWTLPKGKLATGESELDGAIREVLEETGHRIRLGRALGETRYFKEQGGFLRPKVVRWWAMEASGGGFTPNREVDELRWVTLAEAHETLTRETDRELLERFVRGPAPTREVLVVRHASAGSRSGWIGDDRLRPLDESGYRQAEELVRLLAHFDPTEIVSADFVRCRQTVEPLAEALGLEVRETPIVSEEGYPGHEAEAVELLRSVGGPHHTSVVCSQGDVIPDLLARLATADSVDLPPEPSKKGSTWALTFQLDRLIGCEYFPPPTAGDVNGTG